MFMPIPEKLRSTFYYLSAFDGDKESSLARLDWTILELAFFIIGLSV